MNEDRDVNRWRVANLAVLSFAAIALMAGAVGCSLMSNDLPETANVVFSRGAMDAEGNVVKGVDVAAFPASMAQENLEVGVEYEFYPPPQGSTAEVLHRASFWIRRATDPTIGGAVALSKASHTRDVTIEGMKAAATAALIAGTGGAAAPGAGVAELAGRAFDSYFNRPASPAGS